VSAKSFDYVIIGGGTTGLALASRLTEDPSVTVVVLEAGQSHVGDPNITIPGQFGNVIDNPKVNYLLPMMTDPKYCNNRQYLWSRGKGLGGSSTINFYAWSKPPAGDVDVFEKLGNPGWNWKEYMRYSKRSETFHHPSEEQTSLYPHTFDERHRGTSGPIQVTIPHHAHTIDVLFQETLVKKGLKPILDAYGGDITGTWISSSNLDPRGWTRSDAVTGYFLPNKDRPNLTVLLEACVTRILFDESHQSTELTATGVEFIYTFGTHVVHAKREVILSAGAIKDPQVLELSGIGQPEVLSRIGVDVKVDLPGVGENMQDHPFIGVSYELNPEVPHATYDLMFDPDYAQEAKRLYSLGKGMHRLGVTSFSYFPISQANPSEAKALINKAEIEIKQLHESGKVSKGLVDQYRHQIATLRDDKQPDFEVFAFPGHYTFITPREPGKCYFTACSLLNHPFSRGSIHCKTSDPFAQPLIDPHYFEVDFDLELLVQSIKFTRSLHLMEPWKSGVVREVDPGPKCESDADLREYIKNHLGSAWHAVGTCSMLPREKGGVVDPQLKVYGTTNLRVVDISIVPIQVAAHTQGKHVLRHFHSCCRIEPFPATAFVIAEKGKFLCVFSL
ncbi:GMC oxidoreductase, partial [Cyathus striatus]